MVKSWPRGVVSVIMVLCLAACRQPDGPIPEPAADDAREIGDLARDLLAIARGERQAVDDFGYDLVNLGRDEIGRRLVPEMAARFGRALSGRMMTEEQARALAHQMYLTFAATALSPRQVRTIQEDVRAQLTQIGVGTDAIDPIVRQIPAIQAEVTTAEPRWWQVR